MNRRPLLATALIAVFVLTLLPAGNATLNTLQPTARAAAWDKTVRLGWFYARPEDGMSMSTLARRMDWITVTRGHDDWLDDVRDAGFRGDAMQYYMPVEVQGPGPYKNENAWCDDDFRPANNTVAHGVGDFCKYIHPNESWFVHNGDGERLVSRRGSNNYNYHMNPRSEGWRNFVRDRIRRDLAGSNDLGFDGVYFDNVRMRLYNLARQVDNADGRVREFDSDSEYRGEMVEFLRFQRGPINDVGEELWGSFTDFYGVSVTDHRRYLDQLDGYMSEAWGPGYLGRERTVEAEEEVLEIAEYALSRGKGLMALVQGQRGDYNRQRYGLAMYLLINDGSEAYFRYSYLREPYTDWWHYSNYDIDLGEPKGGRYKSNGQWRRDFECGYVTADIEDHRGEIVQKSCSGGSPPPEPTPPPPSNSFTKLPARLQAEDYEKGEGVGYRDTTNGNQGGEYRNDDVDIQSCGSSCYHVSHIIEGEWLAYNVDAPRTDDYAIRLRVAAPDGGQRVSIQVDGREVIGSWTLPGTGDWGRWVTTSKTIRLSEGNHTIKVVSETGWYNLNYILIEDAQDEDDSEVDETQTGDGAAEETPVEDAPVEATPVEEAPVEATPVEDAPVEAAP